MKMKWNCPVLVALLFVALVGGAFAAEENKTYPPTVAQEAVRAAFTKAAADSKKVFLKSGYPECSWCRIFDRYHEMPEVRAILDKYYVIVVIDTKNMADGTAVFSNYAEVGAPSWVIVSPEGKVLASSFGPEGNVGFPANSKEIAHYLAALRKATPTITAEDTATLERGLKQAVEKK